MNAYLTKPWRSYFTLAAMTRTKVTPQQREEGASKVRTEQTLKEPRHSPPCARCGAAVLGAQSTAQVMHEAAEEEAESRTGGDDDGHGGLTPVQEGGMAKVLTVWDGP